MSKVKEGQNIQDQRKILVSIVHGIRNSLTIIKGMTQAIDCNLNDPDFINDFKQVIPKEVDRLHNLIENLVRAGRC